MKEQGFNGRGEVPKKLTSGGKLPYNLRGVKSREEAARCRPSQLRSVPAGILGRLARDLTYRGKGVGELLLVDALKRSLVMSRQIASAAVIVDAKDEKAHKFYRDFGFIPFPESPRRLFLPMATIERLCPEI